MTETMDAHQTGNDQRERRCVLEVHGKKGWRRKDEQLLKPRYAGGKLFALFCFG
jgi:hypothetical protein